MRFEEVARGRSEALRRICESRYRLTASLPSVREVDKWLSSRFQIEHPLSVDAFEEAMASIGGAAASRLLNLYQRRAEAYKKKAPPRTIDKFDRALYESFVDQPFCGLLHSLKRAYILDELVALSILVEALEIAGPVLEVGCNVGYHAGWLASRYGLDVTGVDSSSPAIGCGRRSLEDLQLRSLIFVNAEATKFVRSNAATFDMIYSFDGPLQNASMLQLYSDRLRPGGVLIVSGDQPSRWIASESNVCKSAELAGLHCCLSDVVGGWTGQSYLGAVVLVFVKTSEHLLKAPGVMNATAAWERAGFPRYANSPETPDREKTQSYFRAHAATAQLGVV